MATDTRLRVSRLDKKLRLSYELPHRINTSLIYPVTAPNGATLVVYGYNRGLRILWRGGRPRKAAVAAQARQKGGPSRDVIMLDDEDELSAEQTNNDDFEREDDELDPDCPHPSIMQSLDVPTVSDVLHAAVPTFSSAAGIPKLLRKVALVVVASADGAIRLIQIPLQPPSEEEKETVIKEMETTQIELAKTEQVASSVCLKYLHVDSPPLATQKTQKENVEGLLLVAAASRILSVWSISVTADAVVVEDKALLGNTLLVNPVVRLSFHSSPRHTQLLVAERDGVAQIYDPYAPKPARRPGSSDSIAPVPLSAAASGGFLMSFYTPYCSRQDAPTPFALARRKKILDAGWIMSGKAVLAILEDGQWGIWDTSGLTKQDKDCQRFAFSGLLDIASIKDTADAASGKRSHSKLAPMTPNTRKARTERLFSDTSRPSHTAHPRGGISVSAIDAKTAHMDESVVLWYNSEIYSIASVQSFWQRSISNKGAIGSLYTPGLTNITDLNLYSEHISSISQFAAKSSSAGIGRMNTQRDVMISTEYRIIMLQSLRPPTPARTLFQLAERPTSREESNHPLFDIDRALDDMATGNDMPRRVGFASY